MYVKVAPHVFGLPDDFLGNWSLKNVDDQLLIWSLILSTDSGLKKGTGLFIL